MQPDRNIPSLPDAVRRGQSASVRIPLSIALLSAGFAGMCLSPAAAQVAESTPQTTAVSPDAADAIRAELSDREFRLLHHLVQHQGEVVSRARQVRFVPILLQKSVEGFREQ